MTLPRPWPFMSPLAERAQPSDQQEQQEPKCPECGEPGKHWIESPGYVVDGFWTCSKFYGPDGRRIEP